MVEVGEHYRSSDDATVDAGVYRVVGVPDDATLLRVGDEEGRRVHAGTIHCVSPSALEARFEPTPSPDEGLRPLAIVRNQFQGLYWSVRRFF